MRVLRLVIATSMAFIMACSSPSTGGDADTGPVLDAVADAVADTAPDAAPDTAPDTVTDKTDSASPDPSCAQYCTEVVASCTGTNIQYEGSAGFGAQSICVSYCNLAGWNPGLAADATGNTIGCRHYHAKAALTEDPEVHCPAAGPTGADVCGSWCDNYCGLAATNCTLENALFESNDGCMTACAEFETDGNNGDEHGNTVQCRISYLGAPAFADPEENCVEGHPTDSVACAGNAQCQEYCATIDANCADEFLQFESSEECMSNCAGYNPDGEAGATTGDSLQCRQFHAGAAFDEPSNHCDNAGPGGGSLCVEGTEFLCGTYCGLMGENCIGGNAQYLEDPCLESCNFSSDGTDGDTAGDTIQCRLTYADLAGDDPGVNCNKAGPSGGGVCVPIEESPCGIYCADMDKNCAGTFPSLQDCLDSCPGYNTGGNLGDQTGDTLQCRMTHVVLAGTDPTACINAGPSGGDACTDNVVTPCEDYCGTMAANCLTDPNNPDTQYYPYADGIDCQVQCASWPQNGVEGQQTGNTVQCRTTFAAIASADISLCVNALSSSATCVDGTTGPSACIVYCSLVVSTTFEFWCGALYQTNAACLAQCADFDATGTEGDETGDTLQCRFHYANLAPANTEFCDEAGPTGGQLCQ